MSKRFNAAPKILFYVATSTKDLRPSYTKNQRLIFGNRNDDTLSKSATGEFSLTSEYFLLGSKHMGVPPQGGPPGPLPGNGLDAVDIVFTRNTVTNKQKGVQNNLFLVTSKNGK